MRQPKKPRPELVWHEKPKLINPILLLAFEGPFDAASAATASLDSLIDGHESAEIATVDSEGFFNFQITRPILKFDADQIEGPVRPTIIWPSTEVYALKAWAAPEADLTRSAVSDTQNDSAGSDTQNDLAASDTFASPTVASSTSSADPTSAGESAGPTPTVEVSPERQQRDVVVLRGSEPQLRWREYCDIAVEIVTDLGCETIVAMGSFVGMAPHSRPSRVRASSAGGAKPGLTKSSYEGPTGLLGVVVERFQTMGWPVVSLRVEVPHYVPTAENPKASQALLLRLQELTGLDTGHGALDESVSEWIEEVDELVSSSDEAQEYVTELEEEFDEAADPLEVVEELEDVFNPESIAEIEGFLADQANFNLNDPPDADGEDPQS